MHDDKLIVWITLLGAIILGALVSFFNTLFRMPMNNRDRISKIEERLEFTMKAVEREQEMNKTSHMAILQKLDKIQEEINKINIRQARAEKK